ncbi:hypothetical protein GJ496_008930 [Pomphorhynchus laevis]|nr:hypothetical protein GJ496_008930 [Pomphorhynchus laevis]
MQRLSDSNNSGFTENCQQNFCLNQSGHSQVINFANYHTNASEASEQPSVDPTVNHGQDFINPKPVLASDCVSNQLIDDRYYAQWLTRKQNAYLCRGVNQSINPSRIVFSPPLNIHPSALEYGRYGSPQQQQNMRYPNHYFTSNSNTKAMTSMSTNVHNTNPAVQHPCLNPNESINFNNSSITSSSSNIQPCSIRAFNSNTSTDMYNYNPHSVNIYSHFQPQSCYPINTISDPSVVQSIQNPLNAITFCETVNNTSIPNNSYLRAKEQMQQKTLLMNNDNNQSMQCTPQHTACSTFSSSSSTFSSNNNTNDLNQNQTSLIFNKTQPIIANISIDEPKLNKVHCWKNHRCYDESAQPSQVMFRECDFQQHQQQNKKNTLVIIDEEHAFLNNIPILVYNKKLLNKDALVHYLPKLIKNLHITEYSKHSPHKDRQPATAEMDYGRTNNHASCNSTLNGNSDQDGNRDNQESCLGSMQILCNSISKSDENLSDVDSNDWDKLPQRGQCSNQSLYKICIDDENSDAIDEELANHMLNVMRSKYGSTLWSGKGIYNAIDNVNISCPLCQYPGSMISLDDYIPRLYHIFEEITGIMEIIGYCEQLGVDMNNPFELDTKIPITLNRKQYDTAKRTLSYITYIIEYLDKYSIALATFINWIKWQRTINDNESNYSH